MLFFSCVNRFLTAFILRCPWAIPYRSGRKPMGLAPPSRPACGLALGAAALLAAGGCGRRPAAPARPNVLLVTIDTLRADRLGCYGYWLATTPTLDGLAAR